MLSTKNILEATGGSLVSGGHDAFIAVSIDSRTINEGEFFIPIKGENFDGHDFVFKSLNTCAGALVSGSWFDAHTPQFGDKTVIVVNDTLNALHDIARFIRKHFEGAVVSVVGSNGKTTTKELIVSILATRLKVLKTEGNLNNHIGMPLSMTRVAADTEVMVLEMGTNRPGDIDMLCSIALPDSGIVTNIGMEHMEGFGSMEAVRAEEFSILNYVKKIALNGDDDYLIGGISLKYRDASIIYSIERPGDITAREIQVHDEGAEFLLCTCNESVRIESKLSGRFNIYNSLAAASVARSLGFSLGDIKTGLEAFGGVNMRFEIKKVKGATYIYDVYNANPSSMSAAISELVRMAEEVAYKQGGRSIAVLGDMLELGEFSIPAHEEIASLLLKHKIGYFIGVGKFMERAAQSLGGNAVWCETSEKAGMQLAQIVMPGDVVLLKGSRGMRMEKIMDCIDKGAADDNVIAYTEGRK